MTTIKIAGLPDYHVTALSPEHAPMPDYVLAELERWILQAHIKAVHYGDKGIKPGDTYTPSNGIKYHVV